MTGKRNMGAGPDTDQATSADDIQSDEPGMGTGQEWDLVRADAEADSVTGLLQRYLTKTERWIGAGTIAQVASARRLWADLARPDAGCVLGRVTLDVDAAEQGRPPTPNQPGVAQAVWMALPEHHPLFVAGKREVAVIRYVPSTTYIPDAIKMVNGYPVQPEPQASGFDVSGFQAIIEFTSPCTLEQVESDRQSLWAAVKSMNARRRLELRAEAGDPDPDTDLPEGLRGRVSRATTREAWGV